MWQHAFVAMSLALGEQLDPTVECLGDANGEPVTALIQGLRNESRQARATLLAEHLAPIAAHIEALEVTWHG
jgi:hypothetical protein